MKTYSELTGRRPDFEVCYRFLSRLEGGRKMSPHQHTRWDFLYEGDDPKTNGISMIWPEFISPSGAILPEGEIPIDGKALMFIVTAEGRPFHKQRITIGTRGFFVEGPRKVAECQVVAILGLSDVDALKHVHHPDS